MQEAKQKTATDMLKSAYGLSSGVKPELPPELASAFNLMAHPLAGVVAMSAIGLGFASHALGIWAGALSGAAAASQRLAPKMLDGLVPALDESPAKTVPLVRARLAVVTSLADAKAAAEQAPRSKAEILAMPVPVVVEPAVVAAPATKVEVAAAEVVAPTARVEVSAAEVEAPAAVALEALAEAEIKKPAPAKAKPPVSRAKVQAKAKPTVAALAVKPVATAQPAAIARPAKIDDLKAISGIGPKLEQVLNGLGIWTHAQIAGWSPAEIAWVDDRLGFSGRIGRDDWVGQAAALGAGKAKA